MKTDLTYPIAALHNRMAMIRIEIKNPSTGKFFIKGMKQDISQITAAIKILKSKHKKSK